MRLPGSRVRVRVLRGCARCTTATVKGVTIATHTDRTERNTATWGMVNEGGDWKLDDIIFIETEQI